MSEEAAFPIEKFGLAYWYAIYRNSTTGQLHALRCLDYSAESVEEQFAGDNIRFEWDDTLLIVTDQCPPDLPIDGYRPR